jgi:hypothetical protein
MVDPFVQVIMDFHTIRVEKVRIRVDRYLGMLSSGLEETCTLNNRTGGCSFITQPANTRSDGNTLQGS